MHGPTCIFWGNIKPFSLQVAKTEERKHGEFQAELAMHRGLWEAEAGDAAGDSAEAGLQEQLAGSRQKLKDYRARFDEMLGCGPAHRLLPDLEIHLSEK